MENESKTCGICSIPYDTNDHTPRVLINCGHTLCSHCLDKIIKTPTLLKCPFDSLAFNETQNSLDKFPLNFALLALLEGKKQNTCQAHDKKLTIFCLQEKVKICSDCALFGEHKGHSIKKIKDLKAKGTKLKKDLEEGLMRLKNNQSKKDLDVETFKMEILRIVGSQFEEVKKTLRIKELEWKKQIDNLIEEKIGCESGSLIKIEVEKALEEIGQACQKEENLAILDQDFSSMISRLQSQVGKEEISKISEEISGMTDCFRSFLANQSKALLDFDLLNERIKPEQPVLKEKHKQEQLSSENLIKAKQELKLPKSVLRFGIFFGTLKIWANNGKVFNQIIDLDFFNKMERVNVVFSKYDSLFQGSNDLDNLPQILDQLNYYTSLFIDFSSSGLTNDRALTLLKLLFPRIQHLTEISISFGECEITNQPISFFCTEILPKAISLKDLTLKLGSKQINDFSLPPFSKSLETFHLEAGKTGLTDDCVEKMLPAVEGVKELNLCLSRTRITDHSLRVLGNHMMSCMKNLERFTLDGSSTEITMEGINAIFTGVPKNIRKLVLIFEGIGLSDEVVSLFEEKVCPKLELVEHVVLTLKGTDLKAKMSNILKPIKREAEKRKRANEGKEELE